MIMEKLNRYSKNGYEFSLHHREGDLAIFRGEMSGHNHETWEVVFIQSHNGKQIKENYIPPKEFPPSNTQWGIRGWTATGEEDAYRIFNERKELNHDT